MALKGALTGNYLGRQRNKTISRVSGKALHEN
jgi:hypothetical protein